jgi:ADP-ribosylglycohydrolase
MELVSKPSWLTSVLPCDHGVSAFETLKAPFYLVASTMGDAAQAVFSSGNLGYRIPGR